MKKLISFKTSILIACFLTASLSILAADEKTPNAINGFDQERWKKLMVLIDSEIKTIKGNRYSGAELKHRLFELYSEKIKLIKEKENLNLLKSDITVVQKNGKESFFKSSQEQYKTAQSYAITIINQHPKYERIAEIYYAMAINSRDYGTASDTERFLKLAITHSKPDSKTLYGSRTALAEYYYNNKRYDEAIDYYAHVLKNTNDEWYGKHLYNASWCHLKQRNFKKALELIKNSFETSKEKKYVSMREQVLNAIGIFFVQADATYDGIAFFENQTNPSSTYLIMLAQSSMNKNNFSMTDDVLKAALKDTKKRKQANDEIKVRLAQLDIYRESKKDELFFDTANNILDLYKKNSLNKDDVFIAQNKIKEVAGFMQINLVKDKNKDVVEYNKEDYKKIMRYFDILATLDKDNKKLYRYYQGETALSAQDYQTALKYYVRAIKNAKIKKEKDDITRKSFDAMLTTIELAKLSKAKEDEYAIFTFKNFLSFYPTSDKSQAIYQKLFNKYFEKKDVKKAINALIVYSYHYKSDENIHREMLTQVLDLYIKEKNTDKLALWINKIEKGYLNFSNEYIQNSIAVLGSLLFDKYQEMEKKGKIKEAMNGYESIYDSKKYPKRTKAEAAYAISALNLEQNKSKASAKWLTKSIELYDDKDLIKITPSLFTLANGHRLLQNFETSTEIAKNISKRFCSQKFKNKEDFYQLLNENLIIEQNAVNELIKIEDDFSKCLISDKVITETVTLNMNRLVLADQYNSIISYYKAHEDITEIQDTLKRYLIFKFYQSPELVKKDLLSLDSIKEFSSTISHYQEVLDLIKTINETKFDFSKEDKFNEDKFNQELEGHFATIAKLNNQAIALSKSSTPNEVFLIQKVLNKPYFSLVNSIKNFQPQGVDSQYLAGFAQGMRQITESLTSKGLQIDREKVTFLEKNNYFFQTQKNVIVGEEKELSIEQKLYPHSSLSFSNTLDIASAGNNRLANGQ